MKYLIWSYAYRHDSGGPKVLHRLCHELNEAGQEAYVSHEKTNPEWNTPYHKPFEGDDWIAIYPEIVAGNPWNASRVVRWVLNNPGKLQQGDKVYDPAEIVFTFSELFNDMHVGPERLLCLPTIETDLYFDRHLIRDRVAFYVGKGSKAFDLPGAVEITDEIRADRERLARLLNGSVLMYCFDNVTGAIDIARLCGCPVYLVPNGEYTWEQYDQWVGWAGLGWGRIPPPFDSAVFLGDQLLLKDRFREQLETFIRVTQA